MATRAVEVGFIDVVYVTHDFDDAAQFALDEEYHIQPRASSSPGVAPGLSLARDGTHFGWVKEHSRSAIEDAVRQGHTVICRIWRYGKRWQQWDNRLEVTRQWREGIATCCIYYPTTPSTSSPSPSTISSSSLVRQ
ncbi:hypothetical protein QBC39DRAFT_366505 [Podospora conica]|nr:hypothetical protein QBC39DRAFT_366505 [Schizothecium conicum]